MSTAQHAGTRSISRRTSAVSWLPGCPPPGLYPSLFESLRIALRNSRTNLRGDRDPQALADLGRETGARC